VFSPGLDPASGLARKKARSLVVGLGLGGWFTQDSGKSDICPNAHEFPLSHRAGRETVACPWCAASVSSVKILAYETVSLRVITRVKARHYSTTGKCSLRYDLKVGSEPSQKTVTGTTICMKRKSATRKVI
jgi:hypothetical protein